MIALFAVTFILTSSPSVRAENQNVDSNSSNSAETGLSIEMTDFVDAQVESGNWDADEAATAVANYQEYRKQLAVENAQSSGPFPFRVFGSGKRHENMRFRKGHHALKCPNGRCR